MEERVIPSPPLCYVRVSLRKTASQNSSRASSLLAIIRPSYEALVSVRRPILIQNGKRRLRCLGRKASAPRKVSAGMTAGLRPSQTPRSPSACTPASALRPAAARYQVPPPAPRAFNVAACSRNSGSTGSSPPKSWARSSHNACSVRTLRSLSLCRSLLTAGLVDRFRVVVFPVITGSTGSERIYDGYHARGGG